MRRYSDLLLTALTAVLIRDLPLLQCACASRDVRHNVTCTTVRIDSLRDPVSLGFYREARVCYPDISENETFPLHLFAHGDGAGGALFDVSYGGLQQQLASFGFVVPAYLSCWIDSECYNGESDFLEALKTIEYLEQHPLLAPIDFSKPYTVSGHSTGARVALMLAAIRDAPMYLNGTRFASGITMSMRRILSQTVAFVGDHTDPMNDPKQNPDIQHYDISKSPVFLITGTKDTTEPMNSSWHNFRQISTPDKIHVNFRGYSHYEPNEQHREGPLIAYFCRYYALGDVEARDRIYGDSSDSLVNSNLIASLGAINNGEADIPFLACSSRGLTVPLKLQAYCSSGVGIIV